MPDSNDFNGRIEIRDGSGNTLGEFIPHARLLEQLAERDSLRQEVANLREELAQLRQEKEQAEAQRDRYKQSLQTLGEVYFPITEEDLAEMRQNGVSLEEIIKDLEAGIIAAGGNPSHG